MLKLLKANFKKGKIGLIVVVLFILIAVFLMTAGISVSLKANRYYADKMEEINSPHMFSFLTVVKGAEGAMDKFVDKMSKLDYVESIEAVDQLIVPYSDFGACMTLNGASFGGMTFRQANHSHVPPMKKLADGEGVPIYLPSYYNISQDYQFQAGMPIHFNFKGVEFDGYVAGFYETILYLYSANFYTDATHYEFLKNLVEEHATASLMVSKMVEYKFTKFDFEIQNTVWKDMIRISAESSSEFLSENQIPGLDETNVKISNSVTDINGIISGSEPYLLLISILLIVFSLIITVIALIVITFLIRSGIKDDMRNIGILKALGYTTKELRLSYLLLYGILLGAGALIGMIVAVCMMPVLSDIIQIISNLYMSIPASAWGAVLSLIAVLFVSLGGVYVTTAPLTKITPLYAIRGAVETHSFKKNSFPLNKTKTDVNTALALKSIANNKRQSVMLWIIIFVMTFLCSFSGVIYYNMSVERSAIIDISGIEKADMTLNLPTNATQEAKNRFLQHVRALDEVEEINVHTFTGEVVFVGEYQAVSYMSPDYSKLRTNSIYEGRYPETAREVALSGLFAKQIGKKIGDVVTVIKDSIEIDCVITGLAQSLNSSQYVYMSSQLFVDLLGQWRYDGWVANFFYIYLNKDTSISAFAEKLDKIAKEEQMEIGYTNQRKTIEVNVFNIMTPASELLLTVIIVITAIIAAAVLFMVIRMKMLREKKNFAVYKATGFTSMGLMHQIGLSMLLIALPAAFLGSLLGGLLASPLISLFGVALGLMKITFLVNYWYVFFIFAGVSFLIYLFAVLSALSTKKITPRMLITD